MGSSPEVVPHEVRHVGVEELVVGDTVADRVGERDMAEPGDVDEAGRPERRIGTELHGVQVVVVDTPVDDVDALPARRGAHVDAAGHDLQVAALDELDAHGAGQQRVLVVRGVVDAGREQHDGRVVDAVGRDAGQGLAQSLRVFQDRADAHGREQLGEHLRHGATVREHVADPGGHAYVVLQHAVDTVLVAHQVDAADEDAHATRWLDPGGCTPEVLGRGDEPSRHDVVSHAALRTVHVGEEGLQGADTLGHARVDDLPVLRADDARHDVQRERPLLAGVVERDALREVGAGQRLRPRVQVLVGHLVDLAVDRGVGLAHLALDIHGLVPGTTGRVAGPGCGCLGRAHRGEGTVERLSPPVCPAVNTSGGGCDPRSSPC